MKITTTGRQGALTTFRIIGAAPQLDNLPSIGYLYTVDGDDVIGYGSKSTIRTLEQWVSVKNVEARPNKQPSERKIVEVGRYSVGDTINGNTITGLGQQWRPNVDQYSTYGIDPSAEFVQYAYFN